MIDKPTKEQVEEFWRRCGLKWFWNHNPKCHCGATDDDSNRSWHYRDGNEWKLATRFWHEEMVVDLNSLFKYALPKAITILIVANGIDEYEAVEFIFTKWIEKFKEGYSFSNGLFWVLCQVKEKANR